MTEWLFKPVPLGYQLNIAKFLVGKFAYHGLSGFSISPLKLIC